MNALTIRLSLLIALTTNLVFGQVNVSEGQREEFLNDLVLSFESEFLWKEKGEKIAKALKVKINNGEYASIADADVFVETLNKDLFVLSNDRHLKIDLYEPKPEGSSNRSSSTKTSIFEKERVADGVYNLRFDEFPRLSEAFEKELDELMSSLQNATAIVLDLRNNSGGSDETVNHLIGYFFDEKKKLATSYQWNSEPKELWATPKDQSGAFSETDVIILTSQSTFSAAEIFTQRLQLHNRAIVVGERTPGAAHRTTTYLMNDVFLLDWPYEQSTHARDSSDLEGEGIMPDYLVHYNDAKKVAFQIAESGKTKKPGKVALPKSTKLIDGLANALNAKSNNPHQAFILKYVTADSQDQISRTLSRYRAVWNDDFRGKLTNIHYLPENKVRLFLETSYGTIQMKIMLDEANKIEGIMTRL
ncbi:MAG: S41 family peptidase [Cyclobacteriaceae bacterium]